MVDRDGGDGDDGDGDVGLGLTRTLEAVGAGYCRNLRHLGIVGAVAMDDNHARMLGQVLRDGACPLLEDLDLGLNDNLTGEGLAHVMDAVEHGACSHLKNINLQSTRIGSLGASAVVNALISGSLSHLQSLNLNRTVVGDGPTKGILQALATSCHDLRKIDLTGMGASSQALGAFNEALGGNAWPRLEEIKVFYHDEGMASDLVSILATTGVGTCLRHMEVKWRVNQGVTDC